MELLLGHPGLPLLAHRGRGVPAQVPPLGTKLIRELLHPRDPWEMLKDGDFTHAELMMGTNQDEGRLVYARQYLKISSHEKTVKN